MDKILQYINSSLNHTNIEKEDLPEYIDKQIDECMQRCLDRNRNYEIQSNYASLYLFWKDIKKEVEKEL